MRIQTFTTAISVAVMVFVNTLLAGCAGEENGGGGGGASKAGAGAVTLHTDATWVAFQDGRSGSWTVVTPDGGSGTVYTLDVTDTEGAFGIAAHRLVSAGSQETNKVVQATRDDATDITLFMVPDQGDITGTYTNLTAGHSAIFVTKGALTISGSPITLSNVTYGTRDVIAVETNGGSFVGGVAFRDLAHASNPTALPNVDFGAPTLTINSAQTFTVVGGGGMVSLYTRNDSRPQINNGANYPYLNGTASTDLYVFQGSIGTDNDKEGYEVVSAVTNPGNRSINVDQINALTGIGISLSGLTGLSYTPAATSPALSGWTFSGVQFASSWYVALSKAWLGSDTSYALPNFNGLAGYNNAWDLQSGTLISKVSALMHEGGSLTDFNGNRQAAAGMRAHVASQSAILDMP